MGTLIYAPFDLTGAKFLWWTWHDTDAAVAVRWLGVPVGSTMWTLIHGFAFHAIVQVKSRVVAWWMCSTRFLRFTVDLLCTASPGDGTPTKPR